MMRAPSGVAVDDVDEPTLPVSIAKEAGKRRRAFDHPSVLLELLDRRGEHLCEIRERGELDVEDQLVDVILDDQPRRVIHCLHSILRAAFS
jgi:hypothetical protein